MAGSIAGAVADEQPVSASTERPLPDIDLSDDLLDSYLDGTDTGSDRGGRPTKQAKSLSDAGKDTRSSAGTGSELDEDDTDEDRDEEGEEEDEELDRLLDEDEDEDEEEDEDEVEDSFVPKFDRAKFLQKYKDQPEVIAAYKNMQADYTRAMQGFKQQEQEWSLKLEKASAMESQYKDFQTQLSSDDGMSEFLVNVALHRPKVFDEAYERALSLNEDEGQKKQYLKDQDLKEREAKLEREEKERQKQALMARVQQIEDLTHRAAARLGLKDEAQVEIAEQYVANALHDARARTGKADLSNEEVVAAVKAAAKRLGVTAESAKKQAKLEQRKLQRQATRDRAKDSRRPQPPRGGKAISTPKEGGEEENGRRRLPSNEDPLDLHVDSFFGRVR